jgi:hypothetical protein
MPVCPPATPASPPAAAPAPPPPFERPYGSVWNMSHVMWLAGGSGLPTVIARTEAAMPAEGCQQRVIATAPGHAAGPGAARTGRGRLPAGQGGNRPPSSHPAAHAAKPGTTGW